jgi:hypothetical protein
MNKIKREDLEVLINDGITYKEIAEKYNVSFSTIRRLCSKYELESKFYKLKSKKVNCLNCYVEIKTTIKEDKKFCSHSCSASFNNKKRKTVKKCLNCDIEIIYSKFCNHSCEKEYNYNEYIKKWKEGKVDGISGKKGTSSYIRRYIFKKYSSKCSKCGWCEINKITGKTPLNLEHKDGNWKNNKEDNLDLLCPNCHSLTETYGSLNRGKGRENRYKNGDMV